MSTASPAQLEPTQHRDTQQREGSSFAFCLGVVAPVIFAVGWALFQGILLLPRLRATGGWVLSADMWTPLPAARYSANGAVFPMYEASAGFIGFVGHPLSVW